MEELKKNSRGFWESRYREGQTGWDLGAPSGPLQHILDGLQDKSLRILIPGAGNAWEAEYAWRSGFQQIVVVDIAQEAIEAFRKRVPDFPEEQLLHADFFTLEGQYDLILEQTFFCALHPEFREAYARKMAALLKPDGLLTGVLFATAMNADRPPFGGSETAYRLLFEPYFNSVEFEPCMHSIAPRMGNELWLRVSAAKP